MLTKLDGLPSFKVKMRVIHLYPNARLVRGEEWYIDDGYGQRISEGITPRRMLGDRKLSPKEILDEVRESLWWSVVETQAYRASIPIELV